MNSSTPFLKQLASKCYKIYGTKSDTLTIVFPNKRAGLFFRKYLSELIRKPIWSPVILSIEEFIISFSKKQLANQTRLLFALYTIYKSKIKKSESFENFYPWGEMILNDFNDIDNNLINPERIFKIIKSQKELDDAFYYLSDDDQKTIQSFWANFLPKPTKTQTDFLRTWEILNVLYQDFNNLLATKEISYKGRLYRELSESIQSNKFEVEEKPLWFAGFNALTKTEEYIIKYFVSNKNADIFWDINTYYIDNEIQEAGFFFRKHLKDKVFSKSIKRDRNRINSIEKTDKVISIHSVALSMGQVKAVGEKLATLSKKRNFSPEKTVVVLPDQNLLLPMLNSIPESIEQVNVTMGYLIKNANYFTFIQNLLELIASAIQDEEHQCFKSKTVLSLLAHPVYQTIFNHSTTNFTKEIIEKNKNLLHSDELKSALFELFKLIQYAGESDKLLNALSELLQNITASNLTTLDKAIIFELNNIIMSIEQAANEFDLKMDIKSLAQLFTRLGDTKVPFSGDPLLGLQIMGTLETRHLDFDHIFILSMNENIWPKNTSNNSFIPYNIRKVFDLPVVEHQDAIQSYLFYRLLHHAGTVDIYYNNVSEFNHSGELSRYVRQIQLESKLKIKQYAIFNAITSKTSKPIVIEKSNEILKKLADYYLKPEKHEKHKDDKKDKRLSPSALNIFLDCKLKFYFKYLEKIKEKKELNELLVPTEFGNLFHRCMESFYQSIIDENKNNLIKESDLKSINKRLKRTIKDENIADSGQQLIALQVIEKFATQIIKNDKEYAPFKICALETGENNNYILDMPININGKEKIVGLSGKIDRIDKKGNTVRILDYKSGGDDRKFPSIKSLFDREDNKRNKAAMQVLLYCLIYQQNNANPDEILVPGIFNSKDLFSNNFDVKIIKEKTIITDFSQVKQAYEEELKVLLEDIFDPLSPFVQTKDLKKCEYCPYSQICMRN